MTGGSVRRYDQLEKSPETIKKELRPVVCELRQTDRQIMETYSIDYYTGMDITCLYTSAGSLFVRLSGCQRHVGRNYVRRGTIDRRLTFSRNTWRDGLAVFRDGQKTPSTFGSSFPPNDQTVIRLRKHLRLASAKRYVKFQLDSDKITENFTIACVHVSTLRSPDLLPGTVLNPNIMIRQSSNIVRMCASPARNCL